MVASFDGYIIDKDGFVSIRLSEDDLAAFKKKIRVHSIADQDKTAQWVKQNHPDVLWIYSRDMFRGITATPRKCCGRHGQPGR